jgi:hypothetical protein
MPDREDEKERVDREIIELLNELRVALPGVQVLFAFLLILPFQQGFAKISGADRGVFFACLLTTSASSALLIAPSSWHRLRFRAGDKQRMLFAWNRLAVAGMALLATSMSLAVYLLTDVVIGSWWPPVVAALNAAFFAFFWYVLPLTRRRSPRTGEVPTHT